MACIALRVSTHCRGYVFGSTLGCAVGTLQRKRIGLHCRREMWVIVTISTKAYKGQGTPREKTNGANWRRRRYVVQKRLERRHIEM